MTRLCIYMAGVILAASTLTCLPNEGRSVMEDDLRHIAENQEDGEWLLLPGVAANRQTKSVYLWGEATGLGAHDPAEFFIVSEDSGHDYESLIVSYCKARSVHRALVHIGMRPGETVDYSLPRFWPKGERVRIEAEWTGTDGDTVRHPIENLLVNTRTGEPLPRDGFAFVGSHWIETTDDQVGYAADMYGPHSIVSDYNEPNTVLDVPRKAPDHDVYGYQRPNPALLLEQGTPVRLTLKPEYPEGKARVANYHLKLTPASRGRVAYSLADDRTLPLSENASAKSLKRHLAKEKKAGRDVHASLYIGDELSVRSVRTAAATLRELESEELIRMEPPQSGELFFQAFLPVEKWRAREDRISQPWELHLQKKADTVSALLTQITEVWREDELKPRLLTRDFDVQDGATALQLVQDAGSKYSVLLIFSSPEVTYGELCSFVRPLLSTLSTMYVYIEE